jgi:hypothetical protein
VEPTRFASMALSVNLRDQHSFPTFDSCPDENVLDLGYYGSEDGFFYRPRRHWCLLAEITDVLYLFRLRLLVQDKSGKEFQIHFYLDDDEEVDPSLYRRGNTIAVLYPNRHNFLNMTVGLRLESMKTIQVSTASASENISFTCLSSRFRSPSQNCSG